MPQAKQLSQLQKQISTHFNEEELRALCLELGVDYEDLGGRGKAANARELVMWAQRNGRLADLMALVKAERPDVVEITALLPPHHLPFPENKLFTGRETWLAQLHEQLQKDTPVAVTQAVAGLGGVGKTQLALAYCYRHLDEYDLIQWLRADETTILGGEMAELAYRLGLARRSVSDQDLLRQKVLNWLQTTDRRWLLVYDNADNIEAADLQHFLPKVGNGASLITTRNPNWGGLAQTLHLELFTEIEAVTFLLGEDNQSKSEGEAAKLAKTLGYLPLALEHARAYMAATGSSAADYLEIFETERQALWAEAEAPAAYDKRTITTTWEMAFKQVKQTPGAAVLLNLCCFLAPEEIPLDLIVAGVAEATGAVGAQQAAPLPPLPEDLVALAESKLKMNKAIAALRRYSLITREGDTLSLHRLVQTVARDQIPPVVAQTWLQTAMYLLEQLWPFDQYDLATWAESARFLPHLLTVIAVAAEYNLETAEVVTLSGFAGFYLRYTGNIVAARPYYFNALAIAENTFDQDHTEIALRLNNLGQLLQTTGEYEAARPYMKHALEIDEKALGSDHPDVARDLNNLGQLLQAMGELETAQPLMERALAIYEKALGPDHPYVATIINNLGQLLQDLGEYEAARPYMERALAIDEKALGSDHPDVARDLNNLGQLLQDLGEYDTARPYIERALAIDEKALGPDHPSVARDLNNLELLLQAMGEFETAQPLMERALAIYEKALGPDHPYVATNLNNLGQLLQDLGEYEAARPYMERALAIDEKALGSDHPDVARDLNNLGQLLQATGEYGTARPHMERALVIFEKTLGPDHPNTQVVRGNLEFLLEIIERNA